MLYCIVILLYIVYIVMYIVRHCNIVLQRITTMYKAVDNHVSFRNYRVQLSNYSLLFDYYYYYQNLLFTNKKIYMLLIC